MDEYTLRVVKIDKEAIFELLYETFIAQEQELAGPVASRSYQ